MSTRQGEQEYDVEAHPGDGSLFDEIFKIPPGHRFYCPLTNKIILGRKQSTSNWTPLTDVPLFLSGVEFYLGSSHNSLFQAYARSSLPRSSTSLFIGYSTDDYTYGCQSYDEYFNYTNISDILATASFDNLTQFVYGEQLSTFNGETRSGTLGNLSNLLLKMPRLKMLELHGHFVLDHAISVPDLEHLVATYADWQTPISQDISPKTVEKILSSDFQNLTTLELSVPRCKKGGDIEFSEEFLCGKNMPKLRNFFTEDRFDEKQDNALKQSLVWKQIENSNL